jgi:hypothetical protein
MKGNSGPRAHRDPSANSTDAIRWDENAGLRRDAMSSQVIDALYESKKCGATLAVPFSNVAIECSSQADGSWGPLVENQTN